MQRLWRTSNINKTDALAVAQRSRFKEIQLSRYYYCSAWISYIRHNKVAIRLKYLPLLTLFLHFLCLYTYQATPPATASTTTTPTTTPTIIHVIPTNCNLHQCSLYMYVKVPHLLVTHGPFSSQTNAPYL